MRTRWMGLLIAGVVFGCGGGGGDKGAPKSAGGGAVPAAKAADYSTSTPDPKDPCTLVSQAEMEHFMGPLLEPPYRTNKREPDPAGDGCLYRAKDFRNVTLELDRENGEIGFRMVAGMGGKIEETLAGADKSTAALQGANWDKIGRAFGQLIALKGTASVQVDPLASRLDLPAQVEIVKIAIGRLPKPLGYDGAKAAKSHTNLGVKPRDPCSLVTRAEAEALMGKLRADPHPSQDGAECVYPVAAVVMGYPVDESLTVHWSDGFYELGQARQSMGLAGKTMARQMGPDIPAPGENVAGEKEPWDERITLMGGVITVVRRDVLLGAVGNGVAGFDEAKALTLLRTAAQRI